ncbi:MAG: HNH endonuclease [Alphaproteobacteria bacterium]|nr:HNH endonuclease [Alphaproteobacteria bacterium]
MASKQFQNQLCVYCGKEHSIPTGDHVFARQFFLEEHRSHFPKVPACLDCNNAKAKDETYLTAVLPFGGRHSVARKNLTLMVPKRLAKNQRLKRELADGITISQAGIPTMLPIEIQRVTRLFEMITRALLWHHWNVRLPDQYAIECALLSSVGELLYEKLFEMNSNNFVDISLGNGTFSYCGAQGAGDPNFSIWRYEIYGGLQLTGDPDFPEEVARYVGAISGTHELLRDQGLMSN